MKRLLAKVQTSKPFAALPKTLPGLGSSNPTTGSSAPGHTTAHTVGLKPKYLVPPIPHPCPYDHLALLVTQDGLLIRQHIPGHDTKTERPNSYVRIAWGKPVKVEEIGDGAHAGDVDWSDSVIVYGIIGVLELFSGSYLLVITSKAEVGNVVDGSHTVYRVKGVTAIPLVEEKARITLNTLASRNAQLARPSILPSTTLDTVSSPQDPETEGPRPVAHEAADLERRVAPRVQFSPDDQVKFMTPTTPSFGRDIYDRSHLGHDVIGSPQSSSSDLSTPSSEQSVTTSPVAKTLAERLSFWTRLSKRTSIFPSKNEDAQEPAAIPVPSTLTQERESLDKVIQEGKEEPAVVLNNLLAATAPPPVSMEEQHSELEEKIVRECVREFTRGGMYFAYNFDITRSLQHKQDQIAKSQKQHALLADLDALPSPPESGAPTPSGETDVEGTKVSPMSEPNPTLPLWRRVDKRFWWNEWLSKPFVDAGLHSYVLPIMQGYYQVTHFNIPPDPVTHDEDVLVDYIIISRRSRYRAGLRYQRRGIDDDANVANFVETETVMRVERLGVENIFAYTQIRGSIPLFWTQSGYGLKPPPLLATDRTHAQNLDVLRRHFEKTVPLYGPHTVLNLAEQHGKEGAITEGYREYMRELDSTDARYCGYDFHTETRGMKYENISKLIESMDKTFDAQGYLWISGNTVMSQQKGVFRVNCIDCLDRTNVVQSAFARYVLNKQLGAVALLNPQGEGRTETDIVFNDVWANNGDAISRAYAGTSALKGDFTRTGKRDLSGLLNDGVNSLARMYTSTFSDWFSQAVIDFMLGYRTVTVFSEFLLKLQSTDPRDLIRLSKIRAEAIATSVSRVLAEGERLLSGWTLFAPEELNTKIGDKFEEKVLLLSVKALYIISYDYTLEKVKLYTRVPLGDIIGIKKGAYILSPLEEASRDPAQNAGFVITWHNSNQVTRVDGPPTTSIRPSLSGVAATRQSAINAGVKLTQSLTRTKVPVLSNILTNAALAAGSQTTFAAFKVLPIDPARVRRGSSTGQNVEYMEAADELSGASNCREAADLIVESIRRACEDIGGTHRDFVTNEDVVSLAEAQRMTTVYAKMEYGVKRLRETVSVDTSNAVPKVLAPSSTPRLSSHSKQSSLRLRMTHGRPHPHALEALSDSIDDSNTEAQRSTRATDFQSEDEGAYMHNGVRSAAGQPSHGSLRICYLDVFKAHRARRGPGM
ncbi:putative inositol phosphatase [Lyophyllum shimeji]|uniref:Inositol phosphatase n=1 Tax=Lyophyllum shimeji TaxID=47721 RepID=A0A9P3PFU9_LYOSH|nr:putative inositol phosphatase [Lyophyllum shimeji]